VTIPPAKIPPAPPAPRVPFLSFIPYPLSFLFVLALALIAFWPVVSGAQTLFFGDIGLYFAPLLSFQRAELLQGRIPLWNPYALCGTPFAGNPQAWPLHPSTLLLYAFDAPRACGLIGVLSTVWGAWGTLAFLHRRGVGTGAALIASVAWAFGGAFVSKYQFPNMAQAASWLPWLLWAADGVIVRPHAGRVALLALCVGLSLLSAHAQMFLLQFYVGLAFCGWRLWRLPTGDARRVALGYLAAGFFVGALLASAQLLPVVEQVGASVRPALPLAKANRFILPPYAALTNFVLPNFYGNPATAAPYVARGNFWEPCAYGGVAPFLLAIWTMCHRFRADADVRFWTVVALFCLWLALGRDAGLFAVAFYALPGLSKFHDAARFLHPATFALACLAAHGLDTILRTLPPQPSWTRRAVCAFLLAVVCADLLPFSRTLNPLAARNVWAINGEASEVSSFPQPPSPFPPRRRLYHTDESGVWRRYVSYKTYQGVADPAEVRAFLESLAPNTPTRFGLYDANGYEPVRRADIAVLLDAVKVQTKEWNRARRRKSGAPGHARRLPAPPLFNALAVGATVSETSELSPLERGGGSRLPAANNRATLWTNWRTAPNARAAAALVTRPDWNGVPVAVGVPSVPSPEETGETPPVSLIALSANGPNAVTVALPARHRAGLVVLSDTNAPGWTATVDGRPAVIHSVNGAFRAVWVAASAKNITFRYNPAPWRVGLFASLFALGMMGTAFAYAATIRVERSRTDGRNAAR